MEVARQRIVERPESKDATTICDGADAARLADVVAFFPVRRSSDGKSDGFALAKRERSSSTSSIDSMDSTLSQLIPACVPRWMVVSFDTLPSWLRHNKYLIHGHRPPMPSFSKCFGTMFRLHTETWNIWTHLVGVVIFCVLALCVYVFRMSKIGELPWEEQLITSVFFLGAITCLCLSFLFHTFSNHSENVARLFCRLDYCGITANITCSCIPCYYFSFYCATFSRYLHIVVLIVLCAFCLVFCLLKRFATQEFRIVRTIMFISFGFYSFIPGLQIVIQYGFSYANTAYALSGLIQMASVYVSGAGLYAARIPERFFPGKFDIWASSHQLFHICGVIATCIHYDVINNMVSHRLSIGPDNCVV